MPTPIAPIRPLRQRVVLAGMLLSCAAVMSGCGLAGTAGSAAIGASSEVQEARQAKQTEAHVQQQLQDAQQQAATQRDQAEKDAQ